jgi:hypothetical protein
VRHLHIQAVAPDWESQKVQVLIEPLESDNWRGASITIRERCDPTAPRTGFDWIRDFFYAASHIITSR